MWQMHIVSYYINTMYVKYLPAVLHINYIQFLVSLCCSVQCVVENAWRKICEIPTIFHIYSYNIVECRYEWINAYFFSVYLHCCTRVKNISCLVLLLLWLLYFEMLPILFTFDPIPFTFCLTPLSRYIFCHFFIFSLDSLISRCLI